MVSMAGSAVGQLFLNMWLKLHLCLCLFQLFPFLSILLIVVSKQPDFSVTEFLNIKQLYEASPLGVIAAMMTGLAHGTLWGIGTIYGLKSGLSIEQLSIFMFTFIIGGHSISILSAIYRILMTENNYRNCCFFSNYLLYFSSYFW